MPAALPPPADDPREEGERAFALLDDGLGRRDLLRLAVGLGAGAIVPAWSAVPGATDAFAQAPLPGRGPAVLQPGTGRRRGRYLASTPETIMWGFLPNRRSKPVLRVRSGAVVTIDTTSHEGILEDQGRDPVASFAPTASIRAPCCVTPSPSRAPAWSTTSPTGRTSSRAPSRSRAPGPATCCASTSSR